MMEIKGSETEKNLIIAFAGESMARNRYAIYAKKAKKEGYVHISEILSRISEQERAHGSRLFKFLEGGSVDVQGTFTAFGAAATLENLINASHDEHLEYSELYPRFAEVAVEEGFSAVATVFESIGNAEKHHESTLLKLIEELESNSIFIKEKEVLWHCIKCGYTFYGREAPKACPACAHGRAYFEVLGEN